jgi:glyoxylase-like metal-dependent hydrolase (beta-lactamase superfamily II)
MWRRGVSGIRLDGAAASSHDSGMSEPKAHAKQVVLFVGDLLIRPDDEGPLAFVPSRYQDDAATTRASVRKLLALDAPIVCSGHGAAVVGGGIEAIRRALEEDPEE